MQPLAVNPSRKALLAKIQVAKNFGRGYMVSKYTFSPPERGHVVPISIHTRSPPVRKIAKIIYCVGDFICDSQSERRKPSAQSNKLAPMEPTPPNIELGVLKIPVPIIRPILSHRSTNVWFDGALIRASSYMRSVQVVTPRCLPIPPAVSERHNIVKCTV